MAEIDARRAARRDERQHEHERSDYEHLRAEREAIERNGYEPGESGRWRPVKRIATCEGEGRWA